MRPNIFPYCYWAVLLTDIYKYLLFFISIIRLMHMHRLACSEVIPNFCSQISICERCVRRQCIIYRIQSWKCNFYFGNTLTIKPLTEVMNSQSYSFNCSYVISIPIPMDSWCGMTSHRHYHHVRLQSQWKGATRG